MAGQVKDWAYKKVDWAYNAANWEWTVNVATTAELFKYFSSTTIFRDHANVYDNKHYGLTSKYDGLMIRPVTGQQGYTGVCHFRLYNSEDRYYSDLEGLYGEFTLRDLVLMVFKACGLMVDEDHRTYWLNQVLSLMITLPAERSWVCNTSIRRAGGYQVAAYVDKSIVDDIIDCMRERGMFTLERTIMSTVIRDETYTFDYEETPLDTIHSVYDKLTANGALMARFKSVLDDEYLGTLNDLLGYFSWSYISDKLDAWQAQQNFSLEDDFYVQVFMRIYTATSQYPRARMEIRCFNFIDDEYVAPATYVRADYDTDTQDLYRKGANLPLNPNTQNISEEHNYILEITRSGNITYEDMNTYASGSIAISVYDEVVFESRNNDSITIWNTNFGSESMSGPEGITLIDGAVAPNESTSSSNFWPSWAGRSVTVNAYSGSNHPSYTYIPVGYGDYDYEGFTQARVQSGWIYNNTWLQRLGLTMELMADYEPVEPDPDDPEPIRPDPEPEPEPTPPDPEPIDVSASRLFTVHSLSNAEVDALGSFIYSQTFIDAIKNMFLEPMDAIIGCFILNYGSGGTLPLGANETLKLGSVLGGTGVTGTKVTKQVFELSFGTKSIGHFYNNVLDYAPYTSAQIFLPYIGFCDLDVNEIMGGTVQLKYRIDIFTGACLARLFVTKENNGRSTTQELYNFNGNVAVQIPLTGRDFTNSIGNFITGAASIAIGAATGSPVTAAIGAKGLIGNNATVKRSGTVSSNVGVLGNQTPFIIINRPKAYNALGYNNYYGYPSNWTVTLGSCSGYTRCKDIHLDALSCTDQEREEIETLLREGVIF